MENANDHELDKFGRFIKSKFSGDWDMPLTSNIHTYDEEAKESHRLEFVEKSNHAKAKSSKKLANANRLSGWLAYFTLGVIVSVGYSIYNAYYYGHILSQGVNPIYSARVIALTAAFIALGMLQVASITLLLIRKQFAKSMVMLSLLAGMIIYGFAEVFLNNVYKANNQSTPMSVTDNIDRAEFFSIIWIIYFSVSKRVKQTLIK
jgi:hypothetical protein